MGGKYQVLLLLLLLSCGAFKLEAERVSLPLSEVDFSSQAHDCTTPEDDDVVRTLPADAAVSDSECDQNAKNSQEDRFLVHGLHASSAENISIPSTHEKNGESGSRAFAFRNITADQNSSNHLTLCSSSRAGKAGRTWGQWWESRPLGEKIALSLVGAAFAFAWGSMLFEIIL